MWRNFQPWLSSKDTDDVWKMDKHFTWNTAEMSCWIIASTGVNLKEGEKQSDTEKLSVRQESSHVKY